MAEDGNVVFHSLYVYAPSKIVPIIFTALFGISFVVHVWQCFRYKSWKLCGIYPFVTLLFTAGYALREVGAFHYKYPENKESLMIYIMNQVLIYAGPPLLELANYHILARMFSYIPWLSPIPPEKVFSIFGGLMALVEALNGMGVAFTSNVKGNKQEVGKDLVLASLGLQLCIISSFFVMSTIFQLRCSKANIRNKAIPILPFTLYGSMILILIRSVYRVIEHAGNTSLDFDNNQELKSLSPMLRYEWYFYVFEGITMLANSLLWNVLNAGRFLPQNATVFLAEDGTTEMEIPEDPSDDQSSVAQVGRMVMQVITFGMWGHIFPKEQQGKEALLGNNDEESTSYSHHV